MQNKLFQGAQKQEKQEQLTRLTQFICQYTLKQHQIFYFCPLLRGAQNYKSNDDEPEKNMKDQLQAIAELNDLNIAYRRQRKSLFQKIQKQYEEEIKKQQKAKSTGFSIISSIFKSKSKDKNKANESPSKPSIYQSPLKTIAYMPKQDSLQRSKARNTPQKYAEITKSLFNPSSSSVEKKKPNFSQSLYQASNNQQQMKQQDSDKLISALLGFNEQDKNDESHDKKQQKQVKNQIEPSNIVQSDSQSDILQLEQFSDMPSYASTIKQSPLSQIIQEDYVSDSKSVTYMNQNQDKNINRNSNIMEKHSMIFQKSKSASGVNFSDFQECNSQISQIKEVQKLSQKIQQNQKQIADMLGESKIQNQSILKQDSYSDIKIDWLMKLEAYTLQQKLINNRIYARLNKPLNVMKNMQSITFKDYTKDISHKIKSNRDKLNFGGIIEWKK